jgi:hypothetical protein
MSQSRHPLLLAAAIAAAPLPLAACSSNSQGSSVPDAAQLGDGSRARDTGSRKDAALRDAPRDTKASDVATNDAAAHDTGPEREAAARDASSSDAAPNGTDTGARDAATSAPAAAAAAGFNTLVFEDDFTTADTIAPAPSTASGYKWYWSFDGAADLWSVATTATAASISNGNTGGGSNASPHGGILTLTGPGAPNDALVTVPGGALNNGSAVLPAEGDGNWSHAYFEAYIQFQIDGTGTSVESTGWPAFWSWSVEGLREYGFGGSSLSAPAESEIDFMETYGTIFGNTPGNWTATMHQWPANASSDGDTQHTDSEWHTYGCLWTSTGSGTGQVKFYFDGSQGDSTVDTGTGQTQFSLESMSQFMILGTGKSWDMNVDWVRVWQ